MARRDELTLEGELLRLLETEPFEEFAISLTSGERLEITLRDRLIIGQNVATLFQSGGGSLVIRKNQIVSVGSARGAR